MEPSYASNDDMPITSTPTKVQHALPHGDEEADESMTEASVNSVMSVNHLQHLQQQQQQQHEAELSVAKTDDGHDEDDSVPGEDIDSSDEKAIYTMVVRDLTHEKIAHKVTLQRLEEANAQLAKILPVYTRLVDLNVEQQLLQMRTVVEQLRNQLNEDKVVSSATATELKVADAQREQLKMQVEDLELANHNSTKRLMQYRNECEDLTEQVNELSEELEIRDGQLRKLQKQNQELQAQLQQQQAQMQHLLSQQHSQSPCTSPRMPAVVRERILSGKRTIQVREAEDAEIDQSTPNRFAQTASVIKSPLKSPVRVTAVEPSATELLVDQVGSTTAAAIVDHSIHEGEVILDVSCSAEPNDITAVGDQQHNDTCSTTKPSGSAMDFSMMSSGSGNGSGINTTADQNSTGISGQFSAVQVHHSIQSAGSFISQNGTISKRRRLGHCIPHRLHSSSSLFSINKCGVCQQKIKRNSKSKKCSECSFHCHPECEKEAPPTCGMPEASQMVFTEQRKPGAVSLETLCQKNGELIPSLMQSCIEHVEKHYLHEQGLYRVPGQSSKVDNLLTQFQHGIPNLEKEEVHIICSVLKKFLRDLSDPLIPSAMYDSFVFAADRKESVERDHEMTNLLMSMSPIHYTVLKYLVVHLHKVMSVQSNAMTALNLANCFAPTLLRKKDESPEDQMNNARPKCAVVEILLQLPAQAWTRE